MAIVLPNGRNYFATSSGAPAVGYRLYSYVPGTSTPKDTYTNSTGSVANTNPVVADSRGEMSIYWVGSYDVVLRDASDALVWGPERLEDTGSANDLEARLASAVSTSDGDALVAVKQPYTGAVARTQHEKNIDYVTVKDFGAVGTAVPANVTADAAAFAAALADVDTVHVPEGTYYVNDNTAGITIGPGKGLIGAGSGKTIIFYSGTGNGIYMGSPGDLTLAYLCTLKGITLVCTNRASTVNGVYGDNLVHFDIEDVTVVGSGNPNSAVPADNALYGAGFYLTNNSIIGRITRCSPRIWEKGAWFRTLATSQSHWAAAIVVDGHGEYSSNMYGIVVGDASIPYFSGAGVTVRDTTFQGNYTTGVLALSGESFTLDTCYFEGNANYDVRIGGGVQAPTKTRVHRCIMTSEDIGVTNYGNFPYLAKIRVDTGSFASIVDNDISISTAIPLINVQAAADTSYIGVNRLNSAAASTARISNSSTSTITENNSPEAPRCWAGAVTRTLDAASGTVAITGVGFKPTSIEFFGAVDTQIPRSIGVACVGSGIMNRCMATDATGATTSHAEAIRILRDTAANMQTAVVASFDADGFTLSWTKTGTPPANSATINYIARR